jgi:hypothetical protein
MKRNAWKYSRVVLTAVGFVGALVSCNSHLLIQSGDPEVVVIYPPDVAPPPPVVLDDAGLPSGAFDPSRLTPSRTDRLRAIHRQPLIRTLP